MASACVTLPACNVQVASHTKQGIDICDICTGVARYKDASSNHRNQKPDHDVPSKEAMAAGKAEMIRSYEISSACQRKSQSNGHALEGVQQLARTVGHSSLF